MGGAIVRALTDGRGAVAHATEAAERGATPVVLAVTVPERQLRQGLGADAWVLDAITATHGPPPQSSSNTMFLQSPTMLEMMAMRAEQVASRLENAHVIVDNLNTLVLYNGTGPVQEFLHYLTNRLRARGVSLDLLAAPGPDMAELLANIQAYTDIAS